VAIDGNVWLKPFGSWTDQENRNGVAGYDANIYGLALGVDGDATTDTRLGLAFAYARADIDSDTAASSGADIDVYQLIGYGSHDFGNDIQADFHVGGGVNRTEGRRALPSFGVVAKSEYDSLTAVAGAAIGRTYQLGATTRFTPSVRADYTWIRDDDYTEKHAGSLDLDVNGRSADAFVIGLDGRWSHDFQPGTTASLSLGVGYDLVNAQYSITSAYAGAPGAAFRTEGIDPSPVSLRGGFDLSHHLGDTTEVTLRYDVEHRTDFLNQTASLKVRWAF
jgi:outer membrane autotransporter protein